MPATSEARIASNRKNAARSTGPRTSEGKARSRRNGLKHGMTGSGVVLAEEDAPEVERRASALRAELDPQSELGVILVGQLATLSVRMERAARREEEALAKRVRHAPEEFDRERVERAEALFEAMMRADDPRPLSRELRTSPEGIDRLLLAWADARVELTHPPQGGWSFLNLPKVVRLSGLRPALAEASRPGALVRAALGDFSGLAPGDGEGLDVEARRRWAVDRLVEWVDAEVAKLSAVRESLDLETIRLDRAGAADLALFDDSPEATRARRYESEARRGFFRAFREFRRIEAEVSVREEVAEAEVAPEASPLGSCWETPSMIGRGNLEGPVEVGLGLVRPVSTAENVARGLDGRVLTVGRATFGAG